VAHQKTEVQWLAPGTVPGGPAQPLSWVALQRGSSAGAARRDFAVRWRGACGFACGWCCPL